MIEDTEPRKGTSPWKFTDFVLLIVFSLVGALAASIVLAGTGSDLLNPTVMDVAVTLVGQSVGALAYLRYMSNKRGTGSWDRDFGLRLVPFRIGALFLGIALQIIIGLVLLFFVPEDTLQQGISDVVSDASGLGPRVLIAAMSVVVAPIVEELIFRGVLLDWLNSVMDRTVAIWLSALLFGASHLLDANIYILPGLVVVGVILATVALRDGDLGRAIPIHMGFNLLGVVALFLGLG